MAVRFRKSIKLAPGLRMNLSGGGASWTLGPRGASVGIGQRGTYLNTGIPGSGLYARQRIAKGSSGSSSSVRSGSRPGTTTVSLTVTVSDDGTVGFADQDGNPVSDALIDAAKRQKGDQIRGLITQKCAEINGQVEALGKIHEYTSRPVPHVFETPSFDDPMPYLPPHKVPGFFCRLSRKCVAKVEAENRAADQLHVAEWQKEKSAFEAQIEAERTYLELVNAGDPSAIEQYFEAVLQDITWPRETLVAFDVQGNGAIAIDVDLPEIEEMPSRIASVPLRGYRLSVKDMSATAVQKLYMSHVHSVGFRVAGEAFAASPAVGEVVLSAYSQRSNKATVQVGDEYLYSVKIRRDAWLRINFDGLAQLDVVEALGQFDLRRNMSKTGVFKTIQPIEVGQAA